MRVQFICLSILLAAALVAASPGLGLRSSKHHLSHPSSRPEFTFSKPPRLSPSHATRSNLTCYVQSHKNGSDDSNYILDALNACSNGGTVVFNETAKYIIGTALNLTLQNIDIDVRGYIQFTNDTDYWQANSFPQIFQNVTTFFQLGGSDVALYGGGTIDGNGQAWYDLYAENEYILRPTLIGAIGLHNSSISNLNLVYSPTYYHFVANSTNVVFDNINISGYSNDNNTAKNTDGWDTYRSSDITIQNSVVYNGDDCVSFKPNSTSILVQNVYCNGSHGMSVGSLGQYVGEYDIVEDIYVYNISMNNAATGARIKVWPNTPSALSGDLQGGGGTGAVSNITFDTMYINNVDYAIQIDQCYGQDNTTLCLEYPSPLTISDIVIKNFTGTTSTKYDPEIASLACSSTTACSNVTVENINVLSPSGDNDAYCLNLDTSVLDVTCTNSTG